MSLEDARLDSFCREFGFSSDERKCLCSYSVQPLIHPQRPAASRRPYGKAFRKSEFRSVDRRGGPKIAYVASIIAVSCSIAFQIKLLRSIDDERALLERLPCWGL